MRCKTCDYPLWQLTSRQCPECGTPFSPSDFEFTLNSVRFCCPHCRQAYYGTGAKGHLDPRTFACVSCAKFIDMDQMVLLPTEGVTEKETQVTVVPWVDRRGRGWFKSFFVTMGMAIGNPRRTIEAVPEGSPAGRAFWYMAIHVGMQTMLSGAPFVVGALLMAASVAGGSGASLGFVAAFPLCAVLAPLLVVAGALVVHGILRLTGSTRAGFGRTLHAICYSSGNNFLMGVPCLGGYFLWFPGVIWWAITAGFMLACAQKVRGWRAALAVGLPVLVVFGTVVGGVVAAVYGIQRSVSTAVASMPGMGSTFGTIGAGADKMVRVLEGTATPGRSGGEKAVAQRPRHPAELMMSFRSAPSDFILAGSASDTASCKVLDRTLNQYQFGFGTSNGELRKKLAEDPGAGTSACRVGDFVFTYGDIPEGVEDPKLWLAIGWPDPEINPKDPAEVALVRSEDASVVKEAEFDALLGRQNELRASKNLAPIPHPRGVRATNSAPLTASAPGATRAGGWPGTIPAMGSEDDARVRAIAEAMLSGPMPLRHGGQLLVNDRVQPDEFVRAGGTGAHSRAVMKERVRIGNRTLNQLDTDSERIKGFAVDRAIANLTPGAVAYRIGDTVFTHLGMKLDDARVRASELWIVVGSSAAAGSEATGNDSITVACANGTTRTVPATALAVEIPKQNRLRKRFGLPPIPAPQFVREGGSAGPAADELGGLGPTRNPEPGVGSDDGASPRGP